MAAGDGQRRTVDWERVRGRGTGGAAATGRGGEGTRDTFDSNRRLSHIGRISSDPGTEGGKEVVVPRSLEKINISTYYMALHGSMKVFMERNELKIVPAPPTLQTSPCRNVPKKR